MLWRECHKPASPLRLACVEAWRSAEIRRVPRPPSAGFPVAIATTEKTGEGRKRSIRDMVFDALGIKLRAMLRHTDGDEKIDDEPVAGADARGKLQTLLREED